MIELLLFGVFFVLLALGVPVAFSLGLSAFTVIVVTGTINSLATVPSVFYAQLSAETLLAIPFFILAGTIMEYAGISTRLIELADALVGRFKHGLAMVVVFAALFFSAISGSGPATVAAVGSIMIPALVRRGYTRRHAASLTASAGSMGIIIPPSIAFIIFAVVASEYQRVSIARLFIAGIIPGILLATALLVAACFLPRAAPLASSTSGRAGGSGSTTTAAGSDVSTGASGAFVGSAEQLATDTKHEAVEQLVASGGEGSLGRALFSAIPGMLVPVIILGGIYGGIFTPTESAVVAAVYALLVGLITRQLSPTKLTKVLVVAATQSSTVMLIVGSASVFAYVITTQRIATRMADAILSITDSKFLILLLVMVLLLIVGMFLDAVSALYLLVPILVPVLLEVGVDITTIAVLMVVNLAIGLITPPVGVNLFVAAGIAKAPLTEVVRGVGPFLIASVIVLALVTYIPALSNWLPDLLGV